ncbi:YufK family protein [Robertmurraya andreesenii]|uniref:Small-conductance mechanosensitive channel n=1 Tax=Anoxybacillus andreesenii TaxID=1325932 RepID=A0ABT9V310_9BACL|nr:YufK family protein [Robertmurraya andreesenii]MDQ0155335.1 small-conductance mechanosensitive channel [Robertmurraya andreesenii]
MKNTYLTSYFPLLSILLFSLSLSIRVEMSLIELLKNAGIYSGMKEFFSDGGIKLALIALLLVLFFMVFAALKLIADTINELSLLFFSKDSEGENLKQIRSGSIIYFMGGAVSLLSLYSFLGIGAIFVSATVVYFIYFVFKISSSMSFAGVIGVIFFQVVVWSSLLTGVFYLAVKVYNSIIASLPI